MQNLAERCIGQTVILRGLGVKNLNPREALGGFAQHVIVSRW